MNSGVPFDRRRIAWLGRVVILIALLLPVLPVAYVPFSASVAASETFEAGSIIAVDDPDLYLRSGPGFTTAVLARMKLGTRATVLAGPTWANFMPWYKISTSSYGVGWASGTYLTLISVPTGIPVGTAVEVIDPNLYLRSAPGFASTVRAQMKLGTRATILAGPSYANGHPWYQIQTSLHGTGWASGKYLRAVSQTGLPPTDGLSRLITKGISGRSEVAITIDAGSDRGWARQMLDLFAANGVKVTFGMTGAWAEANPDLVKRMVSEGHQLINHTWSHPSFTGVSASPALTSASARASELTRTADIVYELTGYRMTPNWRPPYGDIDDSVRKDALDAGYSQTIMWSIDSMGWNGASVEQILNACGYNANPGDIILMHVGSSSNDYAALQQLIDILHTRNLTPVTIDQLLE